MKFTDLIALAKNGYSPKDIKDLLALADPEPEPEPEPKPEDPEDPEPEPEERPEEPDPEPEKDYKQMYTDLLKKTQEENRRQDGSKNEKTDDEKLADIFRGMM